MRCYEERELNFDKSAGGDAIDTVEVIITDVSGNKHRIIVEDTANRRATAEITTRRLVNTTPGSLMSAVDSAGRASVTIRITGLIREGDL